MKGWQRGPFGRKRAGVVVRLGEQERGLLARLLDDVVHLLGPEAEPDQPTGAEDPWEVLQRALEVRPPSDPAVARLLPDASRDDPEVAAGFRRLTEYDLRTSKQQGARTAAAALRRPDPVQLSTGEAVLLLKAMTDVRLVVAERLGLRTDEDAQNLHHWLSELEPELDEQDQAVVALASLYEALTYWQESLVGALS